MGPAAWLWRAALVLAVSGGIVMTVAAAARQPAGDLATAPQLGELRIDRLAERYAENHRYIVRAVAAARRLGDSTRARALNGIASPGRHFLLFDASGDGEAVEVLGDLANADRIAVVVPGSDTTLDTFDKIGSAAASLNGGARALLDETTRLAPSTRSAVVAWYGYRAPRTLSTSVFTPTLAEDGAIRLQAFLEQLAAIRPTAQVTLLCHSYGSGVCLRAIAHRTRAQESTLHAVAMFGSPGVGDEPMSQLGIAVPVWAGRGATDWIARVPHIDLHVAGHEFGLGIDPMTAAFGAQIFPAGSGGHGDYLRPGSVPLHNLALIALGREREFVK